MIFIKIPSIVKTDEDIRMEQELGIQTEGFESYTYYNVSALHACPVVDMDGLSIKGKCVLTNNKGDSVVVIDKSPEDYLNLIGGKCVLEIKKNGLD